MAKRGVIMSTTLRARPAAQKAQIVAAVRENVWPLISEGVIRPVIDRELPMTQADEAHRVMTASTHMGKILLLRLSPGETDFPHGGLPPPIPPGPVPPDARPMAGTAVVSGARSTASTR